MLACPASFFKKDSRQAGMTENVVLRMNCQLTAEIHEEPEKEENIVVV